MMCVCDCTVCTTIHTHTQPPNGLPNANTKANVKADTKAKVKADTKAKVKPDTKAKVKAKPLPEEKKDHRLIPGASIPLSKSTLINKNQHNVCLPVDGSSFRVRIGPDYYHNHKKHPSMGHLYTFVGCDVFSCEKKISNIAQYFQIPKVKNDTRYDLPGVIVLNCQVPDYSPKLLRGPYDGVGYSFLIWYVLSDETRKNIKLPKAKQHNSLYLLKRFIDASPNTKHPLRKRWKVITRVFNLDELDFGMFTNKLIQKYNGTPWLIRVCNTYLRYANYLEVDIDAHTFGWLSREGLRGCIGQVKKMVFDWAIVIEGHPDDELPEQILCACRCFKINLTGAKPFPFKIKK